jgi:hypothetical protein
MSPVADGASFAGAHRHWREQHAQIVPDIAGINGYVQNRPLPEWWERVPVLVCAESWFPSPDAEKAAYASEYYGDVIVPDEERFIARDRAWHSLISGGDLLVDGPRASLRVLGFGSGPRAAGELGGWDRVEILHLRRDPPDGGEPLLLSAWTDDSERASALASGLEGVAFVTAPEVIVEPPDDGWSLPPGASWRWQ